MIEFSLYSRIQADNKPKSRYTQTRTYWKGEGKMKDILEIKGKVQFKITLDPGTWIFDDRKVDLDTYFDQKQAEEEGESYEEKMSKYWNREIQEGSIAPPTLKSERKFEKVKLLTGSFGIPFAPFLNNAQPLPEAEKIILERENGNIEIPLESGKNLILGFSKNGKPLKEDGPVHGYFSDGSNRFDPIKGIIGFIID